MSQTLQRVIELVGRRDVYVSEHGYDELSNDKIAVRELREGVKEAQIIEDYPTYHKGPAVLVLYYSTTVEDDRFTSFGALRQIPILQRFLSRHTGQTQIVGVRIF
jgi:hypothetical protein